MSLTNKWYDILNILLLKRRVTLNELSKLTKSSSQTLKKNIELLNGQLSKIAEIKQDKNSVELTITNFYEFQRIMSGSLKLNTDFNSVGKRTAYMLEKMIQQEGFILIDDLAENLQVSRSTVNNDIKGMKESLVSFDVELKGIPNKGIQLIGEEQTLRLILSKYVYDYYRNHYPLKEDTLEWVAQLSKYYKLDQVTVELLKKNIAISMSRIIEKKLMLRSIDYYNNFEYETPLLQEFMFHLETEYRLTLGKYDQDFISFPINTRTTAMVADKNMCGYEQEVRILFDAMMKGIQSNFVTDFNENALFDVLKHHLLFMMNRILFHVDLFDLFMDEIQLKYPFSYELAKVAIHVIEEELMVTVSTIEVSYLAIYFELVLNKKQESKVERKVAIVCSAGRGTATLIHRQLKEALGKDIKISQFSETDYQELDEADYLAIFSTIPLSAIAGVPIIQITNLFDNQLLLQEWKSIGLQSILTTNTVDFSFQVLDLEKSYIENVSTMIEELINEKKLATDFMDLWQAREQLQSTIFDQGIGFPHTVNKGANQIVFRIGVFKQKKSEKNQYVQLVFLVGIPELINPNTEKVLLEIYDLVFTIGANKDYIQEISKFESQQQMLDFINREEIL